MKWKIMKCNLVLLILQIENKKRKSKSKKKKEKLKEKVKKVKKKMKKKRKVKEKEKTKEKENEKRKRKSKTKKEMKKEKIFIYFVPFFLYRIKSRKQTFFDNNPRLFELAENRIFPCTRVLTATSCFFSAETEHQIISHGSTRSANA